MRPICVCIECGAIYLAPENPPAGRHVSPAHCSEPACKASVREATEMSSLSEARLGELGRRARGLEGEPRQRRLNYRPARGHRATAAPPAAVAR